MSAQHTPGPWRIGGDVMRDGGPCLDIMADVNGCRVASVPRPPVNSSNEFRGAIQDANARLIAAAPDLVAALREIAKGEGAFNRDPLTHAENTIENMKSIARAALAKARDA